MVEPESSQNDTKTYPKPLKRNPKVIRAESERAPVSTYMIQFLMRIAIESNPKVARRLRKVQASMVLITRLVLLCTHAGSTQRDALTSESRHKLSSTAWGKFRSVRVRSMLHTKKTKMQAKRRAWRINARVARQQAAEEQLERGAKTH